MAVNRELGDRPVVEFARRDVPLLRTEMSVAEALAAIRQHGVGERIVYFYVTDDEDRLVGVVPTRRLLTADLATRLSEISVARTVTLSDTATVLEACEVFAAHRFLALPVVDTDQHIVGVVDISVFTDEVFDLAEKREVEDLFETIGFRVSQVSRASPVAAFRLRFPWLVATIAGGTACALIAGLFQATLAESLVLAFFFTLVLGLAESVCVQTLSVAVQSLNAGQPTLSGYLRALRREATTAVLIALTAATVVGAVVAVWRGRPAEIAVVGGAIAATVVVAALIGLSAPYAIHALHLDPKVSAGPLALAFTDVATVTTYLALGARLLSAA